MVFCDTSLLLSLYVTDRWTKEATRLVEKSRMPLAWSSWHELEFKAALEARVTRKLTGRSEAQNVYAAVSDHRKTGFLQPIIPDSWEEVFALGAILATKHQFLNRGMDVLNVALCLELGIEKFWTADQRQFQLAQAVGLKVDLARA